MSNFEIHELTEKAINRNSNIIHDTLYGEDYETGKNLAGAVADLASANVAAPYDETVTYAIGQYCLNEGNIYRCIAITTGVFDATAWTQIVVTGEFRRVLEISSSAYAQLTSAEQNNGTLYVLTDEETSAADIPYSAGVSVADKLDSIPIIARGIAKFPAQATGVQTVEVDISSYGFTAKPIAVCCPYDSAVFYNYMKDLQVLDTTTTATKLVLQGNRINASSQWNVAWIAIGF